MDSKVIRKQLFTQTDGVLEGDAASSFRYTRRRFTNAFMLGAGDTIGVILALAAAGFLRWVLKGDHMVPYWAGFIIVLWWIGSFGLKLLAGVGPGSPRRASQAGYFALHGFWVGDCRPLSQ